MPKQFFTERDIEDLAHRGEMSLTITDNVVLTEMAYEKAERLGIKLLQAHDTPPAAPVRPYLSQTTQSSTPSTCQKCAQDKGVNEEELRQRIRDGVKAKLGNQFDSALLETIISRVLNNVGVK
ncbi:MAG: hypothetical protein ABSA51_06580 [Anaerolineaceae bacterium]|jgi:hypothetical protein